MAEELAALSISRLPYDARLAEGEEGEDGEPLIRLRRFAGGRAVGALGESQKNDPRPGDPEKDEAPEKDGEATDGRRETSCGESTSMSECAAGIGEMGLGSVYRSANSRERTCHAPRVSSRRA